MDPPPFPEFEYVEIETSPFPPGKYQIHSIKQPVSTGVRLFKQFIQLLINNGLLPPNGKFILNQRWAQSDGEPGNKVQRGGHSQIVAYYIDGNTHYLDVIDTQKADPTGDALIARGKGESVIIALNKCCDILLERRKLCNSTSFGIVCMVPKVLMDYKYTETKSIIDASLNVCTKVAEKHRIDQERAIYEQSERANLNTQSKRLRLENNAGGPKLMMEQFNLQGAYADATQATAAGRKTHSIWIQVMNMQKACFPSVCVGGSACTKNPLLQSNGLWHILTTLKGKASEKVALGSLVIVQGTDRSASASVLNEVNGEAAGQLWHIFTAGSSRRSILEIYSVCTSPLFELKGVCTTLMSQSMIEHINKGTRCFYLCVRCFSYVNEEDQLDFNDANIGAIKCYLRCGFKFILKKSANFGHLEWTGSV